jgi:hypothetical protein
MGGDTIARELRLLRSDDAGSLYGAPDGTPIYFLLLALGGTPPAEPPTTLTPREAWSYPGAFTLTQDTLRLTPTALARELGLPGPYRNPRAVAWLDSRSQIAAYVSIQWTGVDRGAVGGGGASLEFGNVALKLRSQTPVDVSDDGLTFGHGWIVLERARSGAGGLTPDTDVFVLFGGPLAGRATFAATWDAYNLFRLFRDDPSLVSPARAGELRYFRRDELSGVYKQFVYPTLAAVSSAGEDPTLSLDVELDPGAQFNGARTRMLIRTGTVPSWLRGDYAATVTGLPVGLVPLARESQDRAGFYFALRPGKTLDREHLDHEHLDRDPSGSDSPGRFVYLAPIGPFALEFPAAGGQVVGGSEGLVMCGTSGLEYIAARVGDVFDFVPSCPALATTDLAGLGATGLAECAGLGATGLAECAGLGATGLAECAGLATTGLAERAGLATTGLAERAGENLLDATFTTSWVDFRLGQAIGPRAYFGQPRAAVSFGYGVIPSRGRATMRWPTAVASLVRELGSGPAVADQLPPAPPFPLAIYGGTEDGPAGDAAELLAFEQAVLAPTRGAQLRDRREQRGGDAPAVFKPPDPVFADADGKPLAGARTATPQGFLVDLNDGSTGAAGTWRKVRLARSGDQYLAFDPPPGADTIDSRLATTLLCDQVFLVLNNWSQFPMIERQLAIAGFNFELAPKQPQPDTLLVFKFATSRSLSDLIADVVAWAQPGVFIGDRAAIADAQDALRAALVTANSTKDKPGDPFGYFRDPIASNPAWTGLLSFNGSINGNGMPADLQMLFAGIDGPLRAHHCGVEVNRITRKVPTAPEIEESALFGVVHYQPLPDPLPHPVVSPSTSDDPLPVEDFGFAVETLNVAIRNSAVTDFHAQVAVRIGALFGRAVTLQSPTGSPNTIRLTGQYQCHGDVGTVTFGAPQSASFSFAAGVTTARVLDALLVEGASLAPVAAEPSNGERADRGTQINARVTLVGELSFVADPFPGVEGLDLFSYGRGGRGIGLSGLALDLSCRLDADGRREGRTTIVPDLSAIVLTDEPEALRRGSLVDTLPMTLTGFRQDPQGLDAGKLGALPLNVLELMAPEEELQTDRLPVTRVAPRPPYALEFRLPLGSLGALADVHASLDAALVLGWGPSTYVPDDDGAGIFVQLPALSAGAFGFNLQGLLKTTFGDANLMHIELDDRSVYVLLFNNVALSLLGLRFPPRVIVDFLLFGGERSAQARGSTSLGWSLAATQLVESNPIIGTTVL